MNETELKPCPFCDCKDLVIVKKELSIEGNIGRFLYSFVCKDCGIQIEARVIEELLEQEGNR